nr:hypothetical protein [Eubacterium sp.]
MKEKIVVFIKSFFISMGLFLPMKALDLSPMDGENLLVKIFHFANIITGPYREGIAVCFIILCIVLSKRKKIELSKREVISFALFSLVFACLMTMAACFRLESDLSPIYANHWYQVRAIIKTLGYMFLQWEIILVLLSSHVGHKLRAFRVPHFLENILESKKSWLYIGLIIILFWMPYFIICF